MKKQVTIGNLIKIFLKFWYIPIVLIIVGGFLSVNYAQGKYKPVYTAKSTVVVKQKHESSRYLDQQVTGQLKLIPTYSDFISSDKVMKKVHKELKKDSSYNESVVKLQKKIVVVTKDSSLFLEIESTNRSKRLAVKEANMVAKVFKQQIHTISATSQVDLITKAKKSNVSDSTFSSTKALLYGVILGAVIGLFVEFIIGFILPRKK